MTLRLRYSPCLAVPMVCHNVGCDKDLMDHIGTIYAVPADPWTQPECVALLCIDCWLLFVASETEAMRQADGYYDDDDP